MQKRRLGSNGLEVSAIGLGCMGMSHAYGTPEERDERESIATIHRAIELGVTFFDTAEAYGPYANEELLAPRARGQARPRRHRDQVRLHVRREGRASRASTAGPSTSARRSRPRCAGCRPTASTCSTSTASIPPCRSRTSSARWPTLVREGKVRFLGLSEAGERTIRRAHAVHPIAALQSEYSLWERNLEPRIIPLLRELGIGLVPFAPLGRGFLTGVGEARRGVRGGRLPPRRSALPGRELRRQHARRLGGARAGRAEGRDRRDRSRSPGCCTRARTSCRSPAPSGGATSRRTWARPP